MLIFSLLLIALLLDHTHVIKALDGPSGFLTGVALLIELVIEAVLIYELAVLNLGGTVP